jgi:nicotinate-nucleotide adenylyltransferase
MIGVFGGTFDPIHFGHLRPALDCLQSLGLAEVRLTPLKVAVHRSQPRAGAMQRLAMVQAAVAGEPGLVADGREVGRPGPSYSYDTLTLLRAQLGFAAPICLLVGADAFNGFLTWHRPVDILAMAHLVVMERPGSPGPDDPLLRDWLAERGSDDVDELRALPGGRILRKRVTQLGISSSQIRALIAAGQSPRYLLPDPVLAMIEREGLYRGHPVPEN